MTAAAHIDDGGMLVVDPELYRQLVAQAREAAPEECCGIGIGPPGAVREYHPTANTHETPVTRYRIGAADQLRIWKRADGQGWDVTLVFHSHPATEAWPSATDLDLAAWPDAVYAIMSLAGDEPALRAFRIVDRTVTELPVRVAAAR